MNDDPVVQLGARATTVTADAARFDSLRSEFAHAGYVRLPKLLDAALQTRILADIERSKFVDRIYQGICIEVCLDPSSSTAQALKLLTSDPVLFDVVERITQCTPIGRFDGRVSRKLPVAEHYYDWHSDAAEDRVVAMSLNLSPAAFRGGVLEFRERESGRARGSVRNSGLGDAVLFRIAPDLQHRVTPVIGTAERTALAGWFCSGPDPWLRAFRAPDASH